MTSVRSASRSGSTASGVSVSRSQNVYRHPTDDISYISTRHEQAAAYMADGYARTTGREGVCMVVPGPGLLNAMAGLATAYACSSPVLCIVGQIDSAGIGKGLGVLHEVPHQSRLLDSVTKWHALATDPNDIPALVDEAFRQLRSGRPRPVAIEIPPDVLAAVCTADLVEPMPTGVLLTTPDAASLDRAAAVLAAASRPVIYAGWGVQAADASDELRQVAEALQAPVVMSRGGLGTIPLQHPLAATKLSGRQLMPEADVVLAVGTRFRRYSGATGPAGVAARTIVHLDADPHTLASRTEADVPLLGDARLGLIELQRRLGAMAERSPQTRDVAAAQAWAAEQLAPIEPQMSYLRALRNALPDDGILVSELTQVSYVVRVGFEFRAPRTNITSGYQGTLGYGFPTALGAKVGNPSKAVVSLNGDGGFGWCLQELATARKYDIGIVVVVFNDGSYGNVERELKNRFGGRSLGTDLVNPDFLTLASAFGVPSVRVQGPDDLERAVRDALAGGEPTLVEVVVGEMPDPWPLLG
ncbi:MAG: thiamine pyrophosphate-dependent enzyme [Candidatus Limnocylindrales bacterium]